MKRVRYKPARDTHRRVLTAGNFSQLGVNHTQDETFSSENHFTVLMEDEACDMLVSKLPDEFEALYAPDISVEDETEEGSSVESAQSTADDSSQAEPEGSSSESPGEEMPKGESSPPKSRRKP